MHKNIEGQEATAHQSIYMTYEHVEQNFRPDWPEVRNGLLRQFLDEETPGPTDGSITDAPSRQRPHKFRDKAKQRPVQYVFVKGRAEDTVHEKSSLIAIK